LTKKAFGEESFPELWIFINFEILEVFKFLLVYEPLNKNIKAINECRNSKI